MRLLHPYQSSVVVRSATIIAAALCFAGSTFAFIATEIATWQARQQIAVHIEELVSAVESSANIACFLKDRALGREVVQGLLKNRFVERVTILADTVPLAGGSRAPAPDRADAGAADRDTADPVVRLVYSPFNPQERIGKIVLVPNPDEVHAKVAEFTRFVLILLVAEVVMVALIALFVVFNLVTRPIKQVSDRIHAVAAERGETIEPPSGHEGDEIGRLVADVNTLIARVFCLLQKEQQLRGERETESRKYQAIFDNSETGIFLIDANGHLHSFNRAFRALLGNRDHGLAYGANLANLSGRHAAPLMEMIDACAAGRHTVAAEFELERADGAPSRWIEVILSPVEDGILQGVANDVTLHHRKQEEAQLLAMRDALTGVANRLGFERRIQMLLADNHGERRRAGALMLIDLDAFKQVNDTLGHAAGDAVLVEAARRIESAVRDSDLVARLGGDEFIILLDHIGNPEKLARIAAFVVEKLGQPITLASGKTAQIGASVGIATFAGNELSASEILKRADAAMYAAKRAGKNTYRFCSGTEEADADAAPRLIAAPVRAAA